MAQQDPLTPAFNAAAHPLLKDFSGTVARAAIEIDLGDTPAAHKNQQLIETALLILSQSDTGRQLLQAAKDADYLIVADPETVGGAGAEHETQAQASADFENRLINLKCDADALTLAFRIGHELAHVTQFEAGLKLSITGPHPVSALQQLLAQEADARAYEMKIAIDLATVRAGGAEHLTFPGALDIAAESIGNSFGRALVERIRPKLEDGTLKPENVMLATFKSFYNSISLRAHYEATILHGLNSKAPEILQRADLFQEWRDAADIITRLDSRGTPYLAGAPEGYLDLDSPMMKSASPATLAQFRALEKIRHENPATHNDRPWETESYVISRPANNNAGPKLPAA